MARLFFKMWPASGVENEASDPELFVLLLLTAEHEMNTVIMGACEACLVG